MLNISLELMLSAQGKGEKLGRGGGMKNDGNEEEWEGKGRYYGPPSAVVDHKAAAENGIKSDKRI